MPVDARLLLPLAALALVTVAPLEAGAQETTSEASDSVKPSDSPPEVKLTPEEKAEREGRKACKIDICSALSAKENSGADIACDITKSWRKAQLTKLVAKLKVSWPYGPVRCKSAVNLNRAELVRAVSEEKSELQLEKHTVSCVVDREEKEPTNLTFDFAPKVLFEKGKAVTAQMNWGQIQAPTLLKSALWTATAADNKINMLSGTLVEDINNFISKKCEEVKDEQ